MLGEWEFALSVLWSQPDIKILPDSYELASGWKKNSYYRSQQNTFQLNNNVYHDSSEKLILTKKRKQNQKPNRQHACAHTNCALSTYSSL